MPGLFVIPESDTEIAHHAPFHTGITTVEPQPKCADGYSLQGDDGTSLACVKTTVELPVCGANQALTSDQGKFTCVALPEQKAMPNCNASEVLTVQNGEFVSVYPPEVREEKVILPVPAWSERN